MKVFFFFLAKMMKNSLDSRRKKQRTKIERKHYDDHEDN